MSDTPDPPFTVPAGELIDRLCDEFEAGWKAGRPIPLEDAARTGPESTRYELFRELLAVEKVYRERGGRPITAAEAHSRFAALGNWVEPVIEELLGATGSWSGQPTSSPSGVRSDALGPRPVGLPEFAGGYRVVRELGRGGMGVVYLVDDPLGHRQLAVKMMLPGVAADPIARERFLREARSASAVEHDNVVAIYEVKEGNGTPYLVMPLLKGESLEQRLQREPYSPPALVLKVGREVASGLQAAHDKGLVHRDVKPSNTWLEGDPKAVALADQVRRVKVLDFGLARPAEGGDGVSVTGSVVGTPAYMAPEQARGEKVDGRADLFSLGAILYRMATGRPAFAGPTLTAVLTAIATHHPPPAAEVNSTVPAALSALIGRLLEKEPSKRPRTAREVADALAAIERGQSPPTANPTRRKRWLAGAGALLAICVAVFASRPLFTSPESDGSSPDEVKGAITPPVANPEKQNGTPPSRSEPFRVKSLDVTHFAKTAEGDVPKGILGKDSFSPLLGDRAQVVAKLSRPGYAYVVAFRPDGVVELCFPDDENTVPPLTDTPRYPAADGVKAYGLREGTGLWVFAVVASEKPLPAYRQWLASRKLNWKPAAAPVGSVWLYDGAVLETLFTGGSVARGKDEELEGPAATVRSLGRSLQQNPDAAIGVLGFGVGQRN